MIWCDRCQSWTKRAHRSPDKCLASLWLAARKIERALSVPDGTAAERFAASIETPVLARAPRERRRRRERVLFGPRPSIVRDGSEGTAIADASLETGMVTEAI